MKATKFKVDFDKKIIGLNSKADNKSFSARELYSCLMDIFDEPEYMKYDLPIKAMSENKYKLINGWELDKKVKEFLDGGLS